MTASSTDVTAASNGTDTPTKDEAPAPREPGLNRLREEECYYLTGLVRQALYQAEHLVDSVSSQASDRFTDYSGKKGTTPLDRKQIATILHEAYECTAIAMTYLFEAGTHIIQDAPDVPWAEPGF